MKRCRVGLRYVKAKGRFVPCAPDDKRATIITDVDELGRPLMRDGAGRWMVTPGAGTNRYGPAPAEVVEWLNNRKAKR